MSDLVSVIVPIYNVERYLNRCIDSLLAQTYPNIEIVLIDDCSTDGSGAIARACADAHPDKCVFFPMEKNAGVSQVRNLGIERSRGSYLAFVDSDDWVKPDYISAMYEIARKDRADIVMSGCTYIWDDGHQSDIPKLPVETGSSQREKVAFCRCCMTAKLIRKQLFMDTGIRLSPQINRLEELNVVAPLVSYTDRVSVTHASYYYYYQREDSSSNRNTKNTDIEVFWKSVARMYELAAPGYERELEYHAICELLYGATMVMVRSGRGRKELAGHIDRFCREFPQWRGNPYLPRLIAGKRIFAQFAAGKHFLVLKLLIAAWDLKKKLS